MDKKSDCNRMYFEKSKMFISPDPSQLPIPNFDDDSINVSNSFKLKSLLNIKTITGEISVENKST